MIISCPSCSKKFRISESLIPKDGRLLQCSNCNHKWHFQIPIKPVDNFDPIKLIVTQEQTNDENISSENIKKKKPIRKTKKIRKKSYKKNNETDSKNVNKKLISNDNQISLINSFLIIIITLISIVIILDTFKLQISNYFPIIFPILDNLYNIFFDISSFIKDLIK